MKPNQEWSDTKPTKPGKYHIRKQGADVWHETNVSLHGGELMALHHSFRHRIRLSALCFMDMQWRKVQ